MYIRLSSIFKFTLQYGPYQSLIMNIKTSMCSILITEQPANCPCSNGGLCVQLPSGNTGCSCRYGYSGATCSQRDLCAPNPCTNGGTCVSDGTTIRCVCRPGFKGDLCQTCDACTPNPVSRSYSLNFLSFYRII